MAEHLLDVQNLSVRFHTAQGVVRAVEDVSWHVDRGETLAIPGESGWGKSVSSSAIMNLIDCPPGEIASGRVLFEGDDLLTWTEEQRRRLNGKRIAMIFRDPLSHLNPVHTVGRQIAETLTAHGRPQAEARSRARALVERVGIPDPGGALRKYPHQFSGGPRQRLMIAMALGLKPDLLIADEPTTALDVTVQAEVLSLLQDVQAETGMGLVPITHDLRVVAEGPEPILSCRDLAKSCGGFDALKGVDFDLHAGETLAVVGESGSGKSTVAKLILRLEDATRGTALWKGEDLLTRTPRQMAGLRRQMQMVFQDPTQSLNPRMSV